LDDGCMNVGAKCATRPVSANRDTNVRQSS
jgi:hypothetical protein